MTDLASTPRKTPLAGHWTGKVATSRWCHRCERLHTTRRHAKGGLSRPTWDAGTEATDVSSASSCEDVEP